MPSVEVSEDQVGSARLFVLTLGRGLSDIMIIDLTQVHDVAELLHQILKKEGHEGSRLDDVKLNDIVEDPPILGNTQHDTGDTWSSTGETRNSCREDDFFADEVAEIGRLDVFLHRGRHVERVEDFAGVFEIYLYL